MSSVPHFAGRRDAASPARRAAGPTLYGRIRDSLAADIAGGRLKPGDRLPSERALCDRYQVSRVTIRKALMALLDEGLVEAVAGAGWFVASGHVGEPPNALLSFSALGAARGLRASARVLHALARAATLDEAERLSIVPGTDLFDLGRVRLLEDVPVCIDTACVPLSRAPDLREADFSTASLYAALEREGVIPSRADYAIEAIAADPVTAGELDVAVDSPLLFARQTTYDQHERPFELAEIRYRADRYRFRATLMRRWA